MDNPPEEDEKYKSLSYPVISDEETANQILSKILQNKQVVIGMDTEAAVEMSRFGILCLLQVIQLFFLILINLDFIQRTSIHFRYD